MSLVYPTDASRAAGVSKSNFDNFLKINPANLNPSNKESLQKVATKHALECFDAMEESSLGAVHYIKKHTFSYAAHFGLLVGPAAATLFGLVYFRDQIAEKLLNPVLDFCTFSFEKELKESPNTLHQILLKSLKTCEAGVIGGALYGADKAAKATIGFNPITAALFVVYDSYRTFVGRVSKEVLNSYTKQEDRMEEVIKERRAAIKSQLLTTYSEMANELVKRFENAKDSPTEMRKIKIQIDELFNKLPAVVELFSKSFRLSDAEIHEILHPFHDVIKIVDEKCMGFKQPESEKDHEFNAALLLESTMPEFEKSSITQSAKEHLKEAKLHTLGWGHTFKQSLSVLGSGFAAFTLIPTIAAAAASVADKTLLDNAYTQVSSLFAGTIGEWNSMKPIVAVGTAAIITGTLVSALVNRQYNLQHATSTKIAEDHRDEATSELTAIYNGIAAILKRNRAMSDKNIGSINEKLNKLEEKLVKSGLVNPTEITSQLRQTLIALKAPVNTIRF